MFCFAGQGVSLENGWSIYRGAVVAHLQTSPASPLTKHQSSSPSRGVKTSVTHSAGCYIFQSGSLQNGHESAKQDMPRCLRQQCIYLWGIDRDSISASYLYGFYEIWIMFLCHLYCFLFTTELCSTFRDVSNVFCWSLWHEKRDLFSFFGWSNDTISNIFMHGLYYLSLFIWRD